MMAVIQWNCRGLRANLEERGLRANLEEAELLIQQYSPSVLCLQETLVKGQDNNHRHFSCLYSTPVVRDGRAQGGSGKFVRKNVPHSPVTITSPLQAVAVRGFIAPTNNRLFHLPPTQLSHQSQRPGRSLDSTPLSCHTLR